MKLTLLELVQDILSDMDSDEVNSINDTTESLQVAQIVKSSYFAMLSNRNWPHTRKTITLEPSNDVNRPTHMKLPSNVKELQVLNYDTAPPLEPRKLYKEMKWLEPDAFLHYTNSRNSTETSVKLVTDFSGIELSILKNKAPSYYTSFDDLHVIFDSYDEDVDTTLQETKVQALGYVVPEWEHEDTFTPDLPVEAFTALLEEAKSRAMFKLKQVQDIKAEQETSRQQRWLSRKAWSVNGGIKYPNYGRRSAK